MAVAKAGRDECVAPTMSGLVRGERARHGEVYRGIPYARAERFGLPQPPEPWDGVRDCVRFGPDCPQPRFGRFGGPLGMFVSRQPLSEDCLALNVWTPAADDARRPVMVWLHGGGYLVGSAAASMYDGAAFARDGVVFVSLNYRLHALGALYLDALFEGAVGTGNLGTRDQIAALEWVRDNIAAFGGDPGSVTIFGESAGAGLVGSLLGTPVADGLYQRAILQSGAAHHDLPAPTATRVAHRVLDLIGVTPGDWVALRKAPVSAIVHAATRIVAREAVGLLGDDAHLDVPFLPVIDGVTRDRRSIERVREGAVRGVPLLVGTCADEYRAFVWGPPVLLRRMLPTPSSASYVSGTSLTQDELERAYRQAQPTSGERGLDAAIVGDHLFTIPAIRLAEAQDAAGGRAWMYRFTWPTPIRGGKLGACHGLDVPFVFDTLDRARPLVGPRPPQPLADTMHAAWIRFATDGDPSWSSYEVESRQVLEFGRRVRVTRDPGRRTRLIWDGVW